MASAQPVQPTHRGAPVPNSMQHATSPPSKGELKSWWNKFGRKKDKPEEQVPLSEGIFGVPLAQSIRYANVAISLTNDQGESFIYGYVPIVVAKCGVFLKEKATDVEGIFRLSGSAKRIKDLQNAFNSPDRYGKGLDWTGYTVHDAANILRRYLNQLPEPIVPLQFYEKFRNPLRAYQMKIGRDPQAQTMELEEHARAVAAYKQLITELPALNRQLLLYILDLLAVFASKSDLNRMNAQNLAAIFQPGILSHPSHDMAPDEYRLSQDVLIFLIENQDNFIIGMEGTAMDEKTKDEVKSGPPSIRTPKAAIGRSASTASAGSGSIRRTGGIHRNASLSSRHSRDRNSPSASNPGTPISSSHFAGTAGNTGSLGRSNTVPSNRSPVISGHRFHRRTETGQPATPTTSIPDSISVPPPIHTPTEAQLQAAGINNTDVRLPVPDLTTPQTPRDVFVHESNQIVEPAASVSVANDLRGPQDASSNSPVNGKQTKERKISDFLSKSPFLAPSDPRDANQRQPRKLQKKRYPGANDSAQSSQASLTADDPAMFHTPLATPNHVGQSPIEAHQGNVNTAVTPVRLEHSADVSTPSPTSRDTQNVRRALLQPHNSPPTSIHSRESATDPSDLDALDDPVAREEKRKRRWRRSKAEPGPLAPPPPIGQNPHARGSNSSFGSNRPRKSFTGDSQQTQWSNVDNSTGQPSTLMTSNRDSNELLRAQGSDTEKKERGGFFGRVKAKFSSRDDKDRGKSPPRLLPDQTNSRQSLSAIAHEHFSPRGRSFDRQREGSVPGGSEPQNQERTGSRMPIPIYQGQATDFANKVIPTSAPASAIPPQNQPPGAAQTVTMNDTPVSAPAAVATITPAFQEHIGEKVASPIAPADAASSNPVPLPVVQEHVPQSPATGVAVDSIHNVPKVEEAKSIEPTQPSS